MKEYKQIMSLLGKNAKITEDGFSTHINKKDMQIKKIPDSMIRFKNRISSLAYDLYPYASFLVTEVLFDYEEGVILNVELIDNELHALIKLSEKAEENEIVREKLNDILSKFYQELTVRDKHIIYKNEVVSSFNFINQTATSGLYCFSDIEYICTQGALNTLDLDVRVAPEPQYVLVGF